MPSKRISGVDMVDLMDVATARISGGARDGEDGVALRLYHTHPDKIHPFLTQRIFLPEADARKLRDYLNTIYAVTDGT